MQLTLVREAGPIRQADLPSSAVTIRSIEEADLDAVGRLYSTSYPGGEVGDEADAITDIRASWDGEYGTWLPESSLVAEEDGAVLAAVLIVDGPPWDDVGDLIFIIDLFTRPAYRRRGLAERLVGAALSAVGSHRDVGLRVESENEPAICLYRTLGFVPRRDSGTASRSS